MLTYHVCARTNTRTPWIFMWRSEDNLQESLLTFYCMCRSWKQDSGCHFGRKCLCLVSHLAGLDLSAPGVEKYLLAHRPAPSLSGIGHVLTRELSGGNKKLIRGRTVPEGVFRMEPHFPSIFFSLIMKVSLLWPKKMLRFLFLTQLCLQDRTWSGQDSVRCSTSDRKLELRNVLVIINNAYVGGTRGV